MTEETLREVAFALRIAQPYVYRAKMNLLNEVANYNEYALEQAMASPIWIKIMSDNKTVEEAIKTLKGEGYA
jgi:hypothetical protein